MKTYLLVLLCTTEVVCAQQPAATVSPNEMEQLRQEVRSLTGVVKTLQQQVKDQQAVIDKLNPASPPLPQNPEPSATPGATAVLRASPAPQLIPTEDASVVASAPPPVGEREWRRDQRDSVSNYRCFRHDNTRSNINERRGCIA